jgi:hypothetical protein
MTETDPKTKLSTISQCNIKKQSQSIKKHGEPINGRTLQTSDSY